MWFLQTNGGVHVFAHRFNKSISRFAVLLCLVVAFGLAQAQDTVTVTSDSAAEFTARFDSIFNGGPNFDIADEILSEDLIAHLPVAPDLDLANWKNYVGGFFQSISDLRQETTESFVIGDRIVSFVTYTGTHDGPLFGIPPTNNPFMINGILMFRINADGRAAEIWGQFDLVRLLMQVGVFPPPPDMRATHGATITTAAAALTSGDDDAVIQGLADTYISHTPLGELNQESLLGFFAALRSAMPDLQFTRDQIVADGDFVSTRSTLTGTFTNELMMPTGPVAPTGQPVRLELINIFQFNEEGKITEEWVQFDNLSFLTQLGMMPAPGE
jgi:predicted ester cyclase